MLGWKMTTGNKADIVPPRLCQAYSQSSEGGTGASVNQGGHL